MIVLIAFGFLFLLLIFGGIMAVIEENKDENEYSLWEVDLEKKYGIIFLSDVLYKPEEWKKFDTWYENKNKTYIIELWETTADRNDGLGQVQIEKFKDLGQAIQRAKEIFETSDCVSIEVQSQDREKTYYFRDKINEKYFYVEENTKVEEEELNEPE